MNLSLSTEVCLDVLIETGISERKLVDSPMDSNSKLLPNQGELLDNPKGYK